MLAELEEQRAGRTAALLDRLTVKQLIMHKIVDSRCFLQYQELKAYPKSDTIRGSVNRPWIKGDEEAVHTPAAYSHADSAWSFPSLCSCLPAYL
jgi:hypothetical protein